jgi:2-polyprenyl-3-methyl-5-hydroxy-6-metoxy-1,4-benzoquinol methylase
MVERQAPQRGAGPGRRGDLSRSALAGGRGYLAGLRPVLDVGADTGDFSIPLAQRGFAVTHVDFSPAMLTLARREASRSRIQSKGDSHAASL